MKTGLNPGLQAPASKHGQCGSHRGEKMKRHWRDLFLAIFRNMSPMNRNEKYLFSVVESAALQKAYLAKDAHVPDIVTLTINPAIDIFVNVARVEPTRKMRCSAPKRDPGGGGINVARVAHRLGSKRGGDLSDRRCDRKIVASVGRARGYRELGDAVARRDAREFYRLRRNNRRTVSLRAAWLGASSRANGKLCSTN